MAKLEDRSYLSLHLSPHTSCSLDKIPEASFGLRVLLLPASVCLCVRVSVCVCQSWACPHDNSPLVQAIITKFGAQVQKTLVRTPIVFGGD